MRKKQEKYRNSQFMCPNKNKTDHPPTPQMTPAQEKHPGFYVSNAYRLPVEQMCVKLAPETETESIAAEIIT